MGVSPTHYFSELYPQGGDLKKVFPTVADKKMSQKYMQATFV
jgi:hypothetical protein